MQLLKVYSIKIVNEILYSQIFFVILKNISFNCHLKKF